MPNTVEIWNLNTLCRCCHTDGNFRNLSEPCQYGQEIEVYSTMLRDTFNLEIVLPPLDASYSICDICIDRVRDAYQFKKQIKTCEKHFEEYCKNEMSLNSTEIKSETQENGRNDDENFMLNGIQERLSMKNEIEMKSDDEDDPAFLDNSTEVNMEYEDNIKNTIDNIKMEKDNNETFQGMNKKGITGTKVTNKETSGLIVKKKGSIVPAVKKKNLIVLAIKKKKLAASTVKKKKGASVSTAIQKKTAAAQKKKDKITPALIQKRTPKTKNTLTTFDFSQETVVKTDSGDLYSCKTCGGFYNDKKEIKHHITLNHRMDGPHTCDICQKTFKSIVGMRCHKKTHSRSFKCGLCPRTFALSYLLKVHMNSHTKSEIYKCHVCLKDFLYKSSLRKHLKIHNGTIRRCVCHLCGHTFNDSTNMSKHIRSVHEKLKPFICDLCKKSFADKRNLELHIRRHFGFKPYSCGDCGNRFYTGFERNQHICGTIVKGYRCKVCRKFFAERSSFTKHVRRLHCGQRPYKCGFCERDFTCRYSRNRHQLLHTGVKPFSCEYCGRKFTDKSTLARHILRKHDDISSTKSNSKNRVQCPLCKGMVSNLVKHKLRCNPSSRISCDECHKTYSGYNTLYRHIRTAHMGVKYECDLCNKSYLQRYKLVKHQLKWHKVVLLDEKSSEPKINADSSISLTAKMNPPNV